MSLPGTTLAVQWLRLWASTAGGVGSIPGWGTKIPRAECGVAKKKQNKTKPNKKPKRAFPSPQGHSIPHLLLGL